MKNQVKKFIALCAIVCGFIVSAYAQDPAGAKPTSMTPEQRVEMRLAKMKTNLNLTDAQTAQIKPLMMDELTARKSGDKAAMKANHEKMETSMGKILTPDQMTKYKAMMGGPRGKMPMGGAAPQGN